jgi:Rieske Fe-S protein
MSADGVSRRSVLGGFGITAAAGVAGFVAAKQTSAAKPRKKTEAANAYGEVQSGGRLLATEAEVPAGGGLVVPDAKVVLTRDATGGLHAFSAVCTHQGCTVGSVQGGAILCPCHGSRFDSGTGAVVSGPASAPLAAVTVTVTGSNIYEG